MCCSILLNDVHYTTKLSKVLRGGTLVLRVVLSCTSSHSTWLFMLDTSLFCSLYTGEGVSLSLQKNSSSTIDPVVRTCSYSPPFPMYVQCQISVRGWIDTCSSNHGLYLWTTGMFIFFFAISSETLHTVTSERTSFSSFYQ